jgi:toxin CcdB
MRLPTTTRRFDVLDNPIPRARRAFPFVMILQSDLAETGHERVVAPLVATAAMPPLASRLIPVVTVGEDAYAVLVPSLTAMPATDLRHPVAHLSDARDRVMAALDYLFFGL